jgi:D-galactarate/Altronate dehydratase, C-terminal
VKEKGFVFMDTPGYDPVGATGQVAGGCNIMCFTTGRGSAFGCKPSPSIKLATNSDMYRRMTDDMDINCGDVLDGGVHSDERRRDLRQGADRRLRRAYQIGGLRVRRPEIRAVADRGGDVGDTIRTS